MPARELSGDFGDLAQTLERQIHDAALANLAGGFQWRIARRAHPAAGHGNLPIIAFVATAVVGGDVDGIDAIGILRRGQSGLRLCSVCEGRSHESGGKKTRVSCRSHWWSPYGVAPLRYGPNVKAYVELGPS